MSGDQERSTPYGAWSSPISAEMVASGGIDFGHTDLDGNTIYWREARPAEDGRGVVVRHEGEDDQDVTPDDVNVRTLVHQYGGGDFAVHDDVVFFVRFSDQRVYRQPRNGEPTPITPGPETDRGLRYADFEISADGNHLHPLFYDVLAVPSNDRDDPRAFGRPPHFSGGLFEPLLPNERTYDVADEAMRDVLTAFIEGEVRTVINEAVHGSLLQSYRGSGEAKLAGRMAEWYGDLTGRYEAELQHVEENIRPTIRGFSEA